MKQKHEDFIVDVFRFILIIIASVLFLILLALLVNFVWLIAAETIRYIFL